MIKTRITRIALLAVCAATFQSCDDRSQKSKTKEKIASSFPEVINTQWTDAAAQRTEKLTSEALKKDPKGAQQYALPELRIYDQRRQLIFHQTGIKPGTVAETLEAAIKTDRPIAGPTYASTVADLETLGRRPATGLLEPSGAVTIFDYWATWCIPCKILEKQMLAWAAQKPPGFVRIVRVEADLTKLSKARDEKVYMLKKGPDGKLIKVEMK